jgi:hypothetical protein
MRGLTGAQIEYQIAHGNTDLDPGKWVTKDDLEAVMVHKSDTPKTPPLVVQQIAKQSSCLCPTKCCKKQEKVYIRGKFTAKELLDIVKEMNNDSVSS